MSRIEGKVAQILNDRELVINRGSEHGVEAGMLFDVLNPAGTDIVDPDTNEPLGSVEWPKVRVKVVSVRDKMCVGRTFRTVHIPASGTRSIADSMLSGLAIAGNYKPARDRIETLRSEGQFAQELSAKDSYIHIGDPAVEVLPDAVN